MLAINFASALFLLPTEMNIRAAKIQHVVIDQNSHVRFTQKNGILR